MTVDANELRRYLLGDLPAAAAHDLDTRLFADDMLHRDLDQEQDSLIDDFLAGGLTTDEEEKVRAQIARSPQLHQKVEAFRTFLAALDTEPTSRPRSSLPLFAKATVWLAPAFAFLLCMAVFVSVREFQKSAALSAQLRAQLQASPQTPAPLSLGNLPAAVAFLSANVVRGASALPEIQVSSTDSLIELQVELRGAPSGENRWDAELLRGADVIWRASQLPLRTVGQEQFLVLYIESGSLQSGNYTVRYKPSPSNRETFQIRAFQVTRQK